MKFKKAYFFRLKQICFMAMLLFFSTKVFTQSTRFRHLSVDDGLIQNSINSITQDQQGFMWFATMGGLNRYDGSEFKAFRHNSNDSTTISSYNISFVHADKENNLWIGTRWAGLNKLDLKTHKITRLKFNEQGKGLINSSSILCVAEDNKGFLYFGTVDGGLNIYNKKTKKFSYIQNDTANNNSIASNYVRSIAIDKQGKIWMGHAKHGVSCYNPKTKQIIRFGEWENNPNRKLNNNNAVRTILCDSRNRIWISTWSGGINIYDQKNDKMYSNTIAVVDDFHERFLTRKSLIDSTFGSSNNSSKYAGLNKLRMVFAITEDKSGNIWLASVEEGLVCFNPQSGNLRQFKNNPNDASSLCDNNLLSIFIDKSGIIWAGSLTGGISIFNPYSDKFGHYKAESNQPHSLANSQVLAFHKGKYSNNTYVGILGAVYKFDIEKNRFIDFVVSKKGESLIHDQSIIQAILEDNKGNLWISVNGSGVYVYDTLTKEMENYIYKGKPTDLASSSIFALFEDKNKNVWLGADYGGIDRFDADTKTFIHHSNNMSGNKKLSGYVVRNIADDKEGNLWIATDTGINILNLANEEFRYYKNDKKNKTSLSCNDIQSIYRDKRNRMWIATTNGLSLFDEKTNSFIDYTKKYKVAPNGAFGITEDLNNNLWILSNRGVSKFNMVTNQWKEYNYSDGLQSNEFPSNTILAINNGYVMMGGAKGLNYFLPESLTENLHVPNIVLTNFTLRNKPIESTTVISYLNEVNLNYDHYFFTIEFASLDYTNIAKNKFKYKLEGFSDEWVDLGNKRQVTFVNLDPGEYLFRVAGSNNDGVWNEEGATLKIIITPPFWKTMWFYSLCAFIFIVSIYSYIKYREKKLRKEKIVLEDKVNLRTNELREEKEKVEEANKEIRDSINYAQKIQHAIMPSENDFKKVFPKSFVLFNPKDIVSGDFYWISKLPNEEIIFATADCTGHGVPGGFMSMLGTTFLNEIVNEKNISQPDLVLTMLREKVIAALKQTGVEGENKDGMDITLVKINLKTKKLYYSGANNPLWFIKKNATSVIHFKPDKQPIGYYVNQKEFTLHEISVDEGDTIYTFTDGFPDQFGGPKGKKFKYSSLEKLLLELNEKDFIESGIKLNSVFEKWKGSYEQTDDVCVIGVRI